MSAPATPTDLFAALARLGIAAETVEHEALFTVAQSQALHARLPGGHTKNLFVKDKKGRLFLVTARAEARIDLKRLHEAVGGAGRVSFGSAEQLRAALGVEPGSVTPLAVMNDPECRVSLVIDEGLLREDPIRVHPLVNTMTTSLRRADFLRFLEAERHPPRVLALPEPP